MNNISYDMFMSYCTAFIASHGYNSFCSNRPRFCQPAVIQVNDVGGNPVLY